MSLINTNALVLKSVPFKDSSFILTLLTEEGTTYQVVAHGNRKLASSNNACYQIGNLLDVVLYKKEDLNTMGTISKVNLKNQYYKLKMDYSKLIMMQYIFEVVCKNTIGGFESKELYTFVKDSLDYLNEHPFSKEWKVVWDFHLLGLIGSEPSFESCTRSGKTINRGIWSSQEGGIVDEKYQIQGLRMNENDVDILKKIKQSLRPAAMYGIPSHIRQGIEEMMILFAGGPFNTFSFYNYK